MADPLEIFGKYIPGFITGRAAKLALSAVVVVTILMGACLVIFGGGSPTNFHAAPYPVLFGILYVVVFFLFWIVLLWMDRSEWEDGYTPIRKKLEGNWHLEYSSVLGSDMDNRLGEGNLGASIFINPLTKKLEMKFRIHNNRIYADDDSQIIRVTALRNDHDYFYDLFYYFKGERELQPRVADHLAQDGVYNGKVEVEFVAKLSFEAPENIKRVTEIKGEWYDLNGNISRLLSASAQIDDVAERGKQALARMEPIKLFELVAPSYKALMGDLRFVRDGVAL
jgi:hypothetical protein